MFNVYFFSKTTTTLFITLNGQCGLPFRSHQSDHHSWTTKRRPRSSFHYEEFLNLKDAKKWFSVCIWKYGNKGAKNYFQFIADYIANYVLHLYLGLRWSAVHFGSHIGGIVFCGRLLDALVVHDGHETNFFAQTKLKICE